MQGELQYELQQDLLKNQIKPYHSITKAHTNSIETIATNPDRQTFASGSHDKLIKIWDIEKFKEIMTLSDHKEGIWSLDYTKDGSKLLSASPDKTVGIWDHRKGSMGLKLIGHQDKVYTAKFNQDDKLVASLGEGAELLIWDISKPNSPIQKIQLKARVGYDVAWSKKADYLFATTFSSHLVAIDSKTFQVISTEIVTADQESRCQSVDMNFNTFDGRVFCATDRGNIAWYELKDKKLVKQTQFKAHLAPCRSVTLHPVSKLLLSSGKQGSARLWNCENEGHPKVLSNLVFHKENVTKLAFSGNQIVISGSWDQNIGLWKLKQLLANQ